MKNTITKLLGKLLVSVLIFVLIGGLILWGISDVLNSSKDEAIATVGSYKVTQREVDIAMTDAIRYLNMNSDIPQEQKDILLQSFKQNIIAQLIQEKLLLNYADSMKLELDGEALFAAEYGGGKYRKEQLQMMLNNNGGEARFINSLIEEQKKRLLLEAISNTTPNNDKIADIFFKHNNAKKLVRLFLLKNEDSKPSNQVDNVKLTEFYEKNKGKFLSDEYRSFSFIKLDKKLAENIYASDNGEEIARNASDNVDILLEDILYDLSSQVIDNLAQGASLQEVAQNFNLTLENISSISQMGVNQKGELIDATIYPKNIAMEVFRLNEGDISDVIEVSNGDFTEYVILQLDSITPPRQKAIDEVKGQLVTEYQKFSHKNDAMQIANDIQLKLSEANKDISILTNLDNKEDIIISDVITISAKDYSQLSDFLNGNVVVGLGDDKAKNLVDNILSSKVGTLSAPQFIDDNNIVFASVESIFYEERKIDDIMDFLEIKSIISDQMKDELKDNLRSNLAKQFSSQK